MKVTIDVADRAEGDRIRTALADAETRALVNIVGALLPLSDRARSLVLAFVMDQIEEEALARREGQTRNE